jgi:hypothetical protein
VQPKWSEAFFDAVQQLTGQRKFTYAIAVTRVKGDPGLWERHALFLKAMRGNPIRLVSLQQMVSEMAALKSESVASSQLGRTIQLLRASGATVQWADSPSRTKK